MGLNMYVRLFSYDVPATTRTVSDPADLPLAGKDAVFKSKNLSILLLKNMNVCFLIRGTLLHSEQFICICIAPPCLFSPLAFT